MKLEIKTVSGAVAFTADIACDESTTHSVRLGLAVRVAIAARADLRAADLRAANLCRADLHGADLCRADLFGANLRGAKIRELLASVDRSDGYRFLLFSFEGREPTIVAGCRFFTVAQFRRHVAAEYPGTPKARETLRILDYFAATIAQECGE